MSSLKAIDHIHELEKKDNLTDEEKETIELFKDTTKDVNKLLSRVAVFLTISVKVPTTIVMNRENFVIMGNEEEEIPVFNSDLLRDMDKDEDGVITFTGSGRISIRIDLKVAAFCPYITEENQRPSVEIVLSGLIKE